MATKARTNNGATHQGEKMEVIELLEKATKGVKRIPLTASTRLDEVDPETGKKKTLSKDFEANCPDSLNSAVEILSEKAVYRYFVNALVVDLQSTVRKELEPSKKGERKKAKYLEDLGL